MIVTAGQDTTHMMETVIMYHFRAHRLVIRGNVKNVIAQPMTARQMGYVIVDIIKPIIRGIIS